MKIILDAIDTYKNLAIKCVLETNEKMNLINIQEKLDALHAVNLAIQYFAHDIRMQTWREARELFNKEAAND